MKPSDLSDWKKGDNFSSGHLNEVVQFLKENGEVQGERDFDGNGVSSYRSSGVLVGGRKKGLTGRRFWGKIVANGPKGADEPDFTDNRYWVQACYLTPTSNRQSPIDILDDKSVFGLTKPLFNEDATPEFIAIVSSTNIAEQKSKNHSIPYGEYVEVFEVYERDNSQYDSDSVSNANGSKSKLTKVAQNRWVFHSTCIGAPQYQMMLYQGVAQNKAGFDYPRAHAIFNP